MNIEYLIYQAERPKTAAEQRRIDAVNGRLYGSFARQLHAMAAYVRGDRSVSHPASGRPCRAARPTPPQSHSAC